MLKVVVGKPVLELLNHAKELAQGSGNLKARISVKGQDEIALACGYINQFIEKTHKAVSGASHNSKNVEKQSNLLNSNAISLSDISSQSHKQIDQSFKLGANVGNELGELASLSNKANSVNEKSFLLLEQMLKSLFNVANKVSTVSQNENELAKKVENMVNQAGNIQKTTQITKELLQSINEVSAELKKNAQSVQVLNDDTALLVDDANEVKLCNEDARALVTQCTEKIKISQENIQNLFSRMQENVEVSEKNEEISKILLQVADELKIVCHNLESELNQFQI